MLYSASTLPQFNARHMLVVNYRSYGGSTGKPGQQALYEDGLATYDYLIQRGVAPQHIVVMGRSLGSGIASIIAATRPVRAAILITPFDSLASVAARHYPWLPIRVLLKHPFHSIEWAKKAHAPALFIAAAERQRRSRIARAEIVRSLAGKETDPHPARNGPDNDIESHPDYYPLINEFLKNN